MATHIIHATKTTTQSSTIPNDTINEEILPKLPAKSLARFKCVSKPFNTLISSPEFIDIHLRRSLNSDDNRLLILAERGNSNSNLYSVDVDSPELISKVVSIPLPQTLGEYLSGRVSIVGSLNGLLCIGLLLNDPDKAETEDEYHAMLKAPADFQHVLINPSTGVYRNVPYDRLPYGGQEVRVRFGFGFDEPNNDYKLVRVTENAVQFECLCPFEMTGREVSVYSFKKNEWKLVYDEDRPEYSIENEDAGVVLNKHLLHWVLWKAYDSYRICCFDVRINAWTNDVPLMDDIGYTYRVAEHLVRDPQDPSLDDLVYHVRLGVVHESLCSMVYANKFRTLWIMEEYGVKESWKKLYVLPRTDANVYHPLFPPCYCKGSKHDDLLHLSRKESQFFWYNIRSQTANKIPIQDCPKFSQVHLFKGSLVGIPGGEQIIRVPSQDTDTLQRQNQGAIY